MKQSAILFLIAWFVVGGYYLQTTIKPIRQLYELVDLPQDLKRPALNGADWLAYQQIKGVTAPNAKILALMPDALYFGKMHFFLYPRNITFLANPNGLSEAYKKDDYDVVYIFYPNSEEYYGAIIAFSFISNYDWSEENVHRQLAATLGEKVVGSQDDFKERLYQQSGNYVWFEKNL